MANPVRVTMSRVAIQGELGSNSHMAALELSSVPGFQGSAGAKIVACAGSADVFDAVETAAVECAVLPIENSLHGSVAEHYDLLLTRKVAVVGETLLRVRHNVIARPGVRLDQVRRVMSHPVALSQCRQWLFAHREIEAVPFYDTAGSVKQVMESGSDELAGIAPELAAIEYGGSVLVRGIEDHAENYTRFYVLAKEPQDGTFETLPANKMSVGFRLEHRPGSLMEALEAFRSAGLSLTKIESRPVPGRPWEYVFFVDTRFDSAMQVDGAMQELSKHCELVKELGRYRAAEPLVDGLG